MNTAPSPTRRSPQKLSDFLVEQLLDKIEAEKLAPGSRLATEQELAVMFGVSLRAIREAVARLRMLGILEATQGVGLLVTRTNPTSLLGKVLPIYAAQSESLEDLYLLRRSVELGAIDIAVKNASDTQVGQLLDLAKEYERAADKEPGVRSSDSLGLLFHSTVLEATGNAFLRDMARVLQEYFLRAPRERRGWSQRTKDRVSHLEIARAFEARDASMAWKLMARHLPLWDRTGQGCNGNAST